MEVCSWLYDNGYDFYTESEFKDGGRADIVAIGRGKIKEEFIVEVIESEKVESIQRKKKLYPSEDIRVVRATSQFNYEDIR